MTKSTITRERLEWLTKISGRDDIDDVDGCEIRELASMALAALDSEPVADVVAWSSPNEERKCDIRWRRHDVEPGPLYRHAQPATVVPLPDVVNVLLNHLEDVLPDHVFNSIDVKAWNAVSMLTCPDACRAAMLQNVTLANEGDIQAGNSLEIPEGYVLVPREPTDEMIAAALGCDDVLFNSDETFCVQFGNIYESMIAAAPTQEVTSARVHPARDDEAGS
ncbi:hypothetical protein [Pluralibacter gergoviae]|uniref:hypothetical protein n=1 Tax=Pluralibacter gergoviae TaxID=61647 RepID=UPI002908A63F|nr:hypothetical protein [Pluralibacter gergoviae]MDU4001419.1 hypothetical protein [Pluralibacter gergoviae]